MVRDKKILQREYVGGPLWISLSAYLLLLAIAAPWLVSFGIGLSRLGGGSTGGRRGGRRAPALAPSGGPA
jgi:hypothetical protein